MASYREPSYDQIQSRGSEGPCPSEGGKSSLPSPSHDHIQPEVDGFSPSFPDGDNSSPAVGSVELKGQGDQRKFEEQSEFSHPGDLRVKEGGPHSNPAEAMPGAE
jgi:hypothetical protein